MKIKCLYGDRCRFAHGSGELRNVDSPGTKLSHFFKTKLCYFFEGDQRRFWNDRSHIASGEMAVLSEQLELLRTEKHKADVEHVRKEHALNLKVEAMSKVNSDLQYQIESLLECLEEQKDEIRLVKNEAMQRMNNQSQEQNEISPNRYVFPGAEVFDKEDDSDSSSGNSDSDTGSDDDDDEKAQLISTFCNENNIDIIISTFEEIPGYELISSDRGGRKFKRKKTS